MSQAPCSRVACAPVVDTRNVVALSRPLRRRAAPAAIVSRPGLWKRLDAAARVTMVSARPRSGKSASLRSWIGATGLAERVAWVTVRGDEGDRPGLWPSVASALRQTIPGSGLVRPLMAAPDSGGWAVVERLLTDLAPLPDQLWLVIDDLYKLDSDQARRQLELLVTRAPGALRFLLATRHDMRLRLHRLRLELRRAEPREVAAVHELAASWFEEHGYQADATRHAQAAGWRQWMVLLDRNAQERPRPPLGPLSKSEIRVLKYLAIHLSASEIAGEPSLSTSTVKTHMRNLYRKLGAHSRAEAVQSGRVLGLLAPPARPALTQARIHPNGAQSTGSCMRLHPAEYEA
jgi:ATP/maltotriose-dependent transcriptional regulator MalT